MSTETPLRKATGTRTYSDFILCENFVFRPENVDGFYHHTLEDGSSVTVVFFKAYTQEVNDPEGRIFSFLVSKTKPNTADESH